MKTYIIAWTIALTMAGCGGSKPAPAPPPPTAGESPTAPARKALAQEECTAQGGTVTNDIGDGATQRPDYACPSGKPPLGNIAPAPGGPIAVEGAVCCPA